MLKIGLVEVKQLLQYNLNFRLLFPEFKDEINKFVKCTNCENNGSLLRKILNHKDRIEKFLSDKNENVPKLQDEFKVINTGIENLEEELRKIPIGSRVESLARFDNNVTVIIRIPR